MNDRRYVPEKCSACGGTGKIDRKRHSTCMACGGTGIYQREAVVSDQATTTNEPEGRFVVRVTEDGRYAVCLSGHTSFPFFHCATVAELTGILLDLLKQCREIHGGAA